MSATQSSAPPALFPLSVSFGGQTVDMSVPADIPLTELLPGMVQALGRLDTYAASQGYSVMTSNGRTLQPSLSLPAQGVGAGALLTLEAADAAVAERRYDDLVEAVGDTIANTQTPWQPGDSVHLSAHSAAAIFTVAALLLLTQDAPPLITAIAGLTGTVLVALSAALVARRSSTPTGAISLALSAPVLAACTAHALTPGPWYALPLAAAGLALAITAPTALLLAQQYRAVFAGPLFLGFSFLLVGLLTAFVGVVPQGAAGLVMALNIVMVLLAPWIALAQVPVRVETSGSIEPTDAALVRSHVYNGRVLVLALKGAATLCLLILLPLLATTVIGIALSTAMGVALMLSTRSLHGKAEVLLGVLTGMLLTTATGVLTALSMPTSMPYVIAGAVIVGIFVLALNVVSVRTRPHMTRLADAASVIALLAIPPLTMAVWGLI